MITPTRLVTRRFLGELVSDPYSVVFSSSSSFAMTRVRRPVLVSRLRPVASRAAILQDAGPKTGAPLTGSALRAGGLAGENGGGISFTAGDSGVNYLAHLYLAEDTPASRIGNLLGDFVTGRPESIALPPAVVAGIIRHRAIDRFSDEHPAVARARTLVAGPRRRFANAILDICFDHFLTREWPAPPPLRTFLDQVNAELLAHRRWLPTALDVGLEARIADDWLGHYGSEAGLQEVFDRVAARRPACAAIAGALDDFRAHRAAFSAAFTVLLSDLRRFLENLGPERLYLGTEGGQG